MQPNGMIFWDWNGTLMDDVDFTHGCLNWMLESHGYPQRYDLAQYRELASFAQFGSELDSSTKEELAQALHDLLRYGSHILVEKKIHFQLLHDWVMGRNGIF